MTVLAYNSTTTLARIRAASPCRDGWEKLLASLGKTQADDEPLPLLIVLDSNGLEDALWVLSHAMPDDRLNRHFSAWCAEQVLHLFEAERPNDLRPRRAIEVGRDDSATPEERAAAGATAWVAARAVAWVAAGAVAGVAAGVAAGAAAWVAAGAVAGVAAGDAAGDAAWAEARAAQEAQLRAMISEEL
jgi:hypothetical protein